MKRIIKLINNERVAAKLLSKKACDAGYTDVCYVTGYDFAHCYENATDICNKDYKACFGNGAVDDCKFYFFDRESPCNGENALDYGA